MVRHILFYLLFFCLLSTQLLGQSDQQAYLQGKKYYKEGRYSLASQVFQKILTKESSTYKTYAAFYQGLSFYHSGELERAKDIWLEITFDTPNWENIEEVNFWLSNYYLEKENLITRQRYIDKISNNDILVDITSAEQPVETPSSVQNDTLSKDSTWLYRFIEEAQEKQYTEAEVSSFLEIPENTKKESYKIAVLLPFMHESIMEIDRTSRNKYVMSIMQGMKYALKLLKDESINITLHPYDTKKSGEVTANILRKAELKTMDLVIAPLYPEPSQLAASFCKNNKIPLLNLISTSSKTCVYPYSFYFNPTRRTTSKAIFDYAKTQVDTNKVATIFFQKTSKDEEIALEYKKLLEKEGYRIPIFQGLEKEEAQVVGEIIGEKEEIIIDTLDHRDSIELFHPEILIKTRKAYGEEEDEDYYERLVIPKDSIGHILVSASSPSFGASIVSALEVRDDSILTIGNEKWLNPQVIDIHQLARQNIVLTNPYYIGNEKNHQDFVKSHILEFKEYPHMNTLIGLEAIYSFGKLLYKHGRNFSPQLFLEGKISGYIFDGLTFEYNPDNQSLPIVKIIDENIIKVN